MATIRRISYADILDAPNATELLDEYAAECSLPELGRINPQRHLYETMERAGGMHTLGVYDGNTLTGFAVVLIYPVPHYGRLVATTESIFLASAHRHHGAGRELLEAVECVARAQGCAAVLYSAPAGSRFEGLLKASGDRHSNTIFLRALH